MVKQIEPLKLNNDIHKNKYVHSIDGDLLGTLISISKDNIVVKEKL